MPVGFSDRVGNLVTTMTRPDNMAPILASEALCIAGRTRMAYKRGQVQEARERIIEELTGTIVWLYGVKALDWLGDKILRHILKNNGVKFDVGSDIMRRPFDNFMMNKGNYPLGFSAKKISILKGAKVISAIVLADLFIGFAVPKLNQALSRKLKKREIDKLSAGSIDRQAQIHDNSKANIISPAFTSLAGLNKFTNIIENTNTGKLVATDVGIAGGRGLNARRKEETLDVLVRDIGSMYFYYWARGDISKVMNYLESGGKTSGRLDPKSVNCLNEFLENFISANGGSMSADEFKEKMFGTGTMEIPEALEFEKEAAVKSSNFINIFGKKQIPAAEAAETAKFLEILTNEQQLKYGDIAEKMSTLQPKRQGVSILSKNQIADILKGGEINSPEFLHKMFDNYTDGIYKDEYRYVSHKDLYKHKERIAEYVETIIKSSKNGKVDIALLKKVKNKNLMCSGINFAAGFTVAVAFLSTIIPKIQYYVTKKVTGKDGFPGSDDFGKTDIIPPQINTNA